MFCRLAGAKPLSEPKLEYCQLDPWQQTSVNFLIEIHTFLFNELHFKMASGKWRPVCLGLNILAAFPWPSTSLGLNKMTDIFPDSILKSLSHDDVIKWKHFPRNWSFVRGIHRSHHRPHYDVLVILTRICVFCLTWHWCLSQRSTRQHANIGLGNGLALNRSFKLSRSRELVCIHMLQISRVFSKTWAKDWQNGEYHKTVHYAYIQ